MPLDGKERRGRKALHTIQTLSEKSKLDDITGCWNWTLSRNSYGYGQTSHGGKVFLSHRLMFFLWTKKKTDGKLVCHLCDNRACINPFHLYLGTPLSNMQDMYRRGRARPIGCPGENHPSAKLTQGKVLRIRKLHKTGVIGYRNLGKMFGVDRTVIRGIIKRKYWKHVK